MILTKVSNGAENDKIKDSNNTEKDQGCGGSVELVQITGEHLPERVIDNNSGLEKCFLFVSIDPGQFGVCEAVFSFQTQIKNFFSV